MIKPTPDQIKSWIKKNFGDNFKVAKRGTEIRVNNPLSFDDSYHLWINLRKGVVNDFRPNYKSGVAGGFLSFVMKYRGISFREAVKEVIGEVDFKKHNIFHDDDLDHTDQNFKIELPSGFKKLTYDNDLVSSAVKKYLNKRCIANGKIYVLGIGHCGTDVVFPYYEFRHIVYWQQRSIIDKRFLFPDGGNKSKYVYGIDSIDPTDPVIVTESIFNSLMFENAVAVGGSDFSDDQKQKLRKLGIKKLILAFDNDNAGRSGIAKTFEKLNPYFDLFYSLTDGEPDWNDVAMSEGVEEPLRMLKRNVRKLDFGAVVKLRLSLT